jgi:hypothetical protein
MARTRPAGGWSRRRFLQTASLAALASALPRFAWASEGAVAGPPLSVGYVLGSEDAADVLRPPWLNAWRAESLLRAAGESYFGESQPWLQVVPAEDLFGDPRLAVVPVRLAVLGLYPELDDVPGATFDMVLDVHFATGDPFLPEATFHAWGWRDDPAVTAGAATRFTVPVERDGGLRLSLDVRQVETGLRRMVPRGGGVRQGAATAASRVAAPAAARLGWRQQTVLSVGLDPTLPKLQRGVYLLGLEAGMWAQGGELPAGAFPGELPPSLVVAIDAVEEATGEVF